MKISKEKVLELYEHYKHGATTASLAESVGMSRQALASRFQQEKLPMRPPRENHVKFVEFNGLKYTMQPGKKYFRCTTGLTTRYLHRDVYEHYHKGRIPEGWEIRFIDGNYFNVNIENLVAIKNPHSRFKKKIDNSGIVA